MLGRDRADDIMDATVYDGAGEKIGSVERVYLDDTSGDPAWVSVRSGLFISKERFVPLDGATLEDKRLVVTVTDDAVKNAPEVELEDGRLGKPQAEQLRTYFGLSSNDRPAPTGDDAPRPVSVPEHSPTEDSPSRPLPVTDHSTTEDSESRPVPPPVSPPPPVLAGPGTEHPPPPAVAPTAPPAAQPAPAAVPVAAPVTSDAGSDAGSAAAPDGAAGEDHQGLRLVRRVVVEEQQITVPVVREEYVLEGEPELDEARQDPPPTS